MILAIIKTTIKKDKCKEFEQTVELIRESTRNAKGCLGGEFCRDFEYENTYFLVEKWRSREELDEHLRSKNFRALMGAMNLLSEQTEIKFHTVGETFGDEAVEKAKVS